MTEIAVQGEPSPATSGAAPPSPSRLAPLRLSAFRRLASAYVVNELGNWLGDIALAVLVFDRTGSALATALLFVGTRFVPALLAPLLTARVEALAGRPVLAWLYGLEAALFCALAALDWHFSLILAVVLATADGGLALTAKALTRAATAAVLEPTGQLRAGNAVLNFGFTGVGAAGPIIGGTVVALLSPGAALLLDAATFVAVAALLLRFRAAPAEEETGVGWRDRLRDGLGYARAHPAVRGLLVAQGAALFFFTLVVPVEVFFAKETLDAGSGGYGVLLAAWGIGMVLGGVLFSRAGDAPLLRLLAASAVLIGGGYLAVSVAPTLAWACAGSLLGGVGNGIEWVAIVTALQLAIEPRFQARVMALFEGMSALVPGVGFFAGGALAQLTSPRTTFAVAGFGVLAVVLAGLLLRRGLALRASPA